MCFIVSLLAFLLSTLNVYSIAVEFDKKSELTTSVELLENSLETYESLFLKKKSIKAKRELNKQLTKFNRGIVKRKFSFLLSGEFPDDYDDGFRNGNIFLTYEKCNPYIRVKECTKENMLQKFNMSDKLLEHIEELELDIKPSMVLLYRTNFLVVNYELSHNISENYDHKIEYGHKIKIKILNVTPSLFRYDSPTLGMIESNIDDIYNGKLLKEVKIIKEKFRREQAVKREMEREEKKRIQKRMEKQAKKQREKEYKEKLSNINLQWFDIFFPIFPLYNMIQNDTVPVGLNTAIFLVGALNYIWIFHKKLGGSCRDGYEKIGSGCFHHIDDMYGRRLSSSSYALSDVFTYNYEQRVYYSIMVGGITYGLMSLVYFIDWYLEYTELQEFLLTFVDRANFGYDGERILFAYKINF